jgi:hypothetical protein
VRAPDDPHPDTLHEIIKAHVADDEVRHQKPVVYPITTEPVERLARWKKTFAARRLPVDDIRLRRSDQDASVTVIRPTPATRSRSRTGVRRPSNLRQLSGLGVGVLSRLRGGATPSGYIRKGQGVGRSFTQYDRSTVVPTACSNSPGGDGPWLHLGPKVSIMARSRTYRGLVATTETGSMRYGLSR